MTSATKKPHRDPRMLVEKPLQQDADLQSQEQHAGNKSNKRPVRSVTVNLSESPLGWLHTRGHLTDRQFDAGEKLRTDWEQANLAPNITMRWDAVTSFGGRGASADMLDPIERQIVAKQRFDKALDYLGRDLCDIAWRIICAGEGVPLAEKNLGWPARSGKLVLKIALDRLADFYRLPGA